MTRSGRLILFGGFGVVLSTVFITAAAQTPAPAPRPAAPAPARPAAAPARPAAGNIPRTPEGKPDFSGIWQSFTTANWDLLDHPSMPSDHPGEVGVPPGRSIVEGGTIPYKPDAMKQKADNFAKRATEDPAMAKCLLPGVPRATYMPYPFEIHMAPNTIAIRYAFARALRPIQMKPVASRKWEEGWPDFWMGDSRGSWEGDTLVVDVAKIDERTWFDHAGNYHSDMLHVVERYSFIDKDHIAYEATMDDANVFTRPWKLALTLYRNIDKNAEVMEWDCRFDQDEAKYKDAKPK